MSWQLPAHPHVALPGVETVDAADVVQAPARHVVTTGSIGAGHHPGAAEWDGVHLVGAVAVPHDQLPVLRGRDQVPAVRGPVHGVDLGQVTSQSLPRPHLDPPDLLHRSDCVLQSCVAFLFSVVLE